MMPARVLAQVLRLGSQWLEVKAAALRRTHPARPRAFPRITAAAFWWTYILVGMPLLGWGLRALIEALGLRA
jgi:hypothetical protein